MNTRWTYRLAGALATAAIATPLGAGIAQAAGQWANVDAAGGLTNGSMVKKITRNGTGVYTVKFTAGVGKCAYLSSMSSNGFSPPTAGMVTTAKVAGDGKSVAVRTFDTHSQPADRSFSLQVQCNPTVPFAVVSAAGKLVRGSTGATATVSGPGEYRVTFATPTLYCGSSATIGGPAAKAVKPQLITVTGNNTLPNSVLVRVQSADGVTHTSAFHLQVTCGSLERWGVIVPSSPSTLFRSGYMGFPAGQYQDGSYSLSFPNTDSLAVCSYVSTVSGWGQNGDFPHQAFVWAYPTGFTTVTGRTPDINGNPLSRGISIHVVC